MLSGMNMSSAMAATVSVVGQFPPKKIRGLGYISQIPAVQPGVCEASPPRRPVTSPSATRDEPFSPGELSSASVRSPGPIPTRESIAMKLWLDADAAPRDVKDVCIRACERLKLE